MRAEISVHDGRPSIRLTDITKSERGLLEHFRPFFPASPVPNAVGVQSVGEDWLIVGDVLPGSGSALTAQDATSKDAA